MNRRRFLSGVAGLGSVSVAGCAGGSATDGNTTGNETKGNGSIGIGGSAAINAFVADLEAAGVDVDSTMAAFGVLSLAYWYDPEKHRQDIRRVALTYADHISVSKPELVVSALEPDEETHGTFNVTAARATDYRKGRLSKDAYCQPIIDSYTRK